jgi:hypothetical protein
MLVAFFFFRRGNVARCFLWGVLAGAGFNLIETFQNSLGIVNPDALREQTISSEWWRFAVARSGPGIIHATATGFSALGIYAVLRREWRWLWGYPVGVAIHAAWNFLAYVVQGDVFFSQAGPDTQMLDWVGIGAMILLAASCALVLRTLPRLLKDERPAPLYVALGMLPAAPEDPQEPVVKNTSGTSPPGTRTFTASGWRRIVTGVSPAASPSNWTGKPGVSTSIEDV